MNHTTATHRLPLCLLGLSLLGLGACATTEAVKDPEGYDALVKQREASNAKIKADASFVPKVMQDFEKSIDKYFQAVLKSPDPRAVKLKKALDRILRQEVRKNFDLLLMKAESQDDPAGRGVALVALGFADETDVEFVNRGDHLTKKAKKSKAERRYADAALNALISGLGSADLDIVDYSLLGLGLLAHEDTPVHEIGGILEDSKKSLSLRRDASWALVVMQPQLTPDKRKQIRPIMQRLLSQPLGDVEPTVLSHALASVGHFRDKRDAKLVEPYCKHPMASVRIRAAIALGEMQNPDSYKALLDLIREAEVNENVRLAGRKALKALAGGTDRGYDVKLWEQLFTRK